MPALSVGLHDTGQWLALRTGAEAPTVHADASISIMGPLSLIWPRLGGGGLLL